MLATSELRFIPLERKVFYQRYSTFGFQYIFLRSNLPIERLSVEDLAILERYIEAGSSDVTEELLDLVSRTYRSIIIVWADREHETFYIIFSDGGEHRAPNDALVFEIGHATEFDENRWILCGENERAKRQYLTREFIPLMEERLSEELGIRVVVFDGKR